MNKRRWSLWIGIIALSAIVLASGCTSNSLPAARSWMDIELTDVRTGQTFRISDFSGKPILLESFAVWCPTCLRQQNEIKKVKSSEGDDIVHISLDTDPN